MIHKVDANQKSFHPVIFTTGLNVIVAERSDSSSEKDTRNGVGKSTLIEIIDFCLGSRPTKGKGLTIDALDQWVFMIEITLKGNKVEVSRAISDPNRIVIKGPTNGWVEQPDIDDDSGEKIFKPDRWRALLGWALFDLPRSVDQLPYKPSYRSLISYFVRRRSDAYADPFRHFRQQKTWDIQMHTAYLLGMNWEYASRWQGLKDKEDGVKAIEKAIKTGAMEGAIGTVGELETQRIQLEQQTKVAKEALNSFKVHPQYEELQHDANRLTKKIHELTNQNIIYRRRLENYEESIKEEKSAAGMTVEKLYEESGHVLPEMIRRTLDEAREFHSTIILNRQEFLQNEKERLKKAIDGNEKEIKELIEQRAKVMQILSTHGALQEMTTLQERHLTLEASLEHIQTRLREMKNIKITKREVKVAKDELAQTAERDHEQRRDVWSESVRLFNEHSQELYKRPGKLVIDVNEKGYKYSVDIERSGSEGIEKMKIYCFDLAMLQIQMRARDGIDFLIHDTLLYDSVDARQRALSFERAHEITSELGGQYICTINSDMVPENDFSEDFDFKQCVRLTLSDATPAESLLGIRFERNNK